MQNWSLKDIESMWEAIEESGAFLDSCQQLYAENYSMLLELEMKLQMKVTSLGYRKRILDKSKGKVEVYKATVDQPKIFGNDVAKELWSNTFNSLLVKKSIEECAFIQCTEEVQGLEKLIESLECQICDFAKIIQSHLSSQICALEDSFKPMRSQL